MLSLSNPDPFLCVITLGGGYFSFPIPEDTYDITVSVSGYSSLTKSVTVSAGEPTRVSFALAPKRLPVLLVHGFQRDDAFNPRCLWEKMAEYLSGRSIDGCSGENSDDFLDIYAHNHTFWKVKSDSEGQPSVYISNYSHHNSSSPTFCDMRLYAYQLAQEISWICSHEGVDELDLVAHSMGGLVARAYIENSDFSENLYATDYEQDVRKLIMLGTPNHGVPVAVIFRVFGYSATSALSAQQMIPDSPFLSTLNHGCKTCTSGQDVIASNVDYYVIAGNIHNPSDADILGKVLAFVAGYGEHDGLVSVESACLTNVGLQTYPLDHSALRTATQTLKKVESLLLEETGL